MIFDIWHDEAARRGVDPGAARSLGTLSSHHGREPFAEAPSRDAVEEEVDAVVDEDEEVADGLGAVVRDVGAVFPVRLADQQDDARGDADQERQRDAEAHERRLAQVGPRPTASGRLEACRD